MAAMPVRATDRKRALDAFLDELLRRDPEGTALASLAKVADLEALSRQAAATVVDAGRAWREALGPLYDVDAVRRLLGRNGAPITKQAVSKRRDLLALRTGSGRLVYPAFQFRGSGVVPGLGAVLAELPPELVSRWTVASWLVSPEPELDGDRPVDVLASGATGAVVAAARRWAAALSG